MTILFLFTKYTCSSVHELTSSASHNLSAHPRLTQIRGHTYSHLDFFAALLHLILLIQEELAEFGRLCDFVILPHLLEPGFECFTSLNHLRRRQRKQPLRREKRQGRVAIASPTKLSRRVVAVRQRPDTSLRGD